MLHSYRGSSSLGNNRVDRSAEVLSAHRRLDALARLFTNKSKQAAVCIINKKLYIAAAELYQGMPDNNEIISSIQETNRYLIKVARRENPSSTEKRALFEKICAPERLKRDLLMIANVIWVDVPAQLFEQVTRAVFEGEDPRVSEFKTLYGSHEEIAMLLHVRCRRLYVDLIKVEESLKSRGNEHALLREAFASGEFNILQKEKAKEVHPEVQILSNIVRFMDEAKLNKDQRLDNKLYIGSSELNCLDCRMLIKAANSLFRSEIVLETRGYKDVRFDWKCPDGFSKEHSAYNSGEKWNSVAQMIYYKSVDLQTSASSSSSEASSEDEKQSSISNKRIKTKT